MTAFLSEKPALNLKCNYQYHLGHILDNDLPPSIDAALSAIRLVAGVSYLELCFDFEVEFSTQSTMHKLRKELPHSTGKGTSAKLEHIFLLRKGGVLLMRAVGLELPGRFIPF